jgi:hypothetical protein
MFEHELPKTATACKLPLPIGQLVMQFFILLCIQGYTECIYKVVHD